MDALLISLDLLTTPQVILVVVVGVAWGIFGGALPGISPPIAMALLLPFTYTMEPIPALILLAATYMAAEYGGSIPAILIRTPGTNAAAATLIEGYEMQRRGRGGLALGVALVASVIGSVCGLIFVVFLTKPLAAVALAFKAPAYFALGILGLSVVATVSDKSLMKGVIGALVGLMIATIGTDPVSGVIRYAYGNPELLSGVPFVLVMVGLFAVSELLEQVSLPMWEKISATKTRLELPSLSLQRKLLRANFIGVAIGGFCGLMPGAGGTVAAFLAYNEAKRFAHDRDEFGKGAASGVAAPESANNCDAAMSMVPLLAFGIPASTSAAILLGGFLIHGLAPGPALFARNPEILYGLFTGMAMACVALPFIAFATLKLCVRLVNQPKPYLMAFILALIFAGSYSINNSLFDLGLVLLTGVIGFGMRFFGVPVLPVVLGVVLGYLIESQLPPLAGHFRRRTLDLRHRSHLGDLPDAGRHLHDGVARPRVPRPPGQEDKGYKSMSAVPSEATGDDVPVSTRLSQWSSLLDAASIPPEVSGFAKKILLDVAGLCVSARGNDYVAASMASCDDGPCTAFGHERVLDAYGAALVNGTAAHGEDFDDTFEGGPVHSGAVVIPAVLAAAERFGLSGPDVLAGIVAGIETQCRLSLVAPKAIHSAGFHPTAVLGALAAAAGVARAMRLDTQHTAWALGVAGSMASGIIEYLSDGSWTKRMHVGWSAQSGLRAAVMAKAGFVGPRTVLEGPHGLYKAFAPGRQPDFDRLLDGLGEHWHLPTIGFKPHACGTMTQPYVDCAAELGARGIAADDVVSIVCEVGEGTVHRLWHPLADKQNPPTAYFSKFSGPYCMAVAFFDGTAGLAQFTEERVADPAVRSLARKIFYVVDPDNPYPARFTGHLRATLRDGGEIEIRRDDLRGGVRNPMSPEEFEAKYFANTAFGGWSRAQADRLRDFCLTFDKHRDMSDLAAFRG